MSDPWRVHADGSPVHVWPENDRIEHDLDGDECVCGPTVERVPRDDGSMGWLVSHHSLSTAGS